MKLKFHHEHISWKLALWVCALIITAIVSSVITWYVNSVFIENGKTKIYDYAYIEKSQINHPSDGDAECWNGISSRADTYKCAQGNLIYAPCFRDDLSNKVKCPRSPISNSDAKYFNAKFTDTSEQLLSTYGKDPTPWFIYLATGEECGYLYGATTTVANKRLDFGCKNSPITLYLPIKEKDGVNTISCMKNGRLEDCYIKELWR